MAKLERKKIEDELEELKALIKELTAILKSPKMIKQIIKKELKALKEDFGDERRTKVFQQQMNKISDEDLIPKEETIITLTQGGYIKRINPKTYKTQKRGGKGILGMKTVGEDVVKHFFSANTHDNLLFFTDSGKVFRIPAYEIPEGSRTAKGRGLLNFLELSSQEKVLSIIPLSKKTEEVDAKYLILVTKGGIVKKTALEQFKNIRRSGLIAISLKKGDLLKEVCKTTGKDEMILVTKKGKSIRFKEKEIRPMGRSAAGVKGISLKGGDELVGADVINLKVKTETKVKQYLLVVTDKGYGKRTILKEYRLQKRGGIGIKTLKLVPKIGTIVASRVLSNENQDLIVISQQGQTIRIPVNSVSKLGRATQGVRIKKLNEKDKIVSIACL